LRKLYEIIRMEDFRPWIWSESTGRFRMFSVITNIYNKKTKGPTLMELFTATGNLKKFFFDTLHHGDACVARNWISYRCVCHVTSGAHIERL
jgi:hypothetical protein